MPLFVLGDIVVVYLGMAEADIVKFNDPFTWSGVLYLLSTVGGKMVQHALKVKGFASFDNIYIET